MTFKVEALKAQLEELDVIIQKLEETIEQRQEECAQILRDLKAATSRPISKPFIHRLPNEVLVEIFRRVSHSQRLRNITLMRVCGRWLNVVSDTAILWRKIDLDIGDPMHAKPLLVYVITCIERSKATDLAITLHIHRSNPLRGVYDEMIEVISEALSNGLEYMIEWINAFNCGMATNSPFNPSFTNALFVAVVAILKGRDNRFTDRWTHFARHFRGQPIVLAEVQFMWESLDCKTPNLRHIFLSGPCSWAYGNLPFTHLGSLQSLRLQGDTNIPSSFYDRLPNLQQLSISIDSFSTYKMVMAELAFTQFPALEYMQCRFPTIGPAHEPFGTIHLPALKSLDLEGGPYEEVLPCIDAPTLERLALSDHQPLERRDFSAIPILQSVTRLEWQPIVSEEEDLDARLLAVVSKLPRLEIVYLRNLNRALYAGIEAAIAQLVAEGKTKARLMSGEEARINPFPIPFSWE